MKEYENLYLSKDQWEKFRNSITKIKKKDLENIKMIAAARIKKSLKAIKLSQQRLVELKSFNALLKKHNLYQKSISREKITKLLNEIKTVSDRDFIDWIEIFMSFFYTELCIFLIPEECAKKIPEDRNYDPEEFDTENFNVALEIYCRNWEDRKDELKNDAMYMKEYEDQNSITSRKKAIIGHWKGDAVQEFKDGNKIIAKIEGELTILQDDIIRGELKYSFEFNEEKIVDTIKLRGRFLYGSFLRLNYVNSDDFVKQFGSAILELDPTGFYLDGKFIGFGSRSKKKFKADAYLKKVFID